MHSGIRGFHGQGHEGVQVPAAVTFTQYENPRCTVKSSDGGDGGDGDGGEGDNGEEKEDGDGDGDGGDGEESGEGGGGSKKGSSTPGFEALCLLAAIAIVLVSIMVSRQKRQ